MASKKDQLSPLMRQYFEIKSKYPETILFFQVGDFYELFGSDAKIASELLGIALTKRGYDSNNEPIALAGVPRHVFDHYLAKLIKAGFKIAICDQLEQPKDKSGKIIERGVRQVLTPGTLTDLNFLDEKSASYLAISYPYNNSLSLIIVELLTGQLYITNLIDNDLKSLTSELSRFMPDEIVMPNSKESLSYAQNLSKLGYFVSQENIDNFINDETLWQKISTWFEGQFNKDILNICFTESARRGLILLYSYLSKNNERSLSQIKQLFTYAPEDFLMLDSATQHNLELVKNTYDGTRANTLVSVIDKAVTAMGSRTIKKWLQRPLINEENINQRLDSIELLLCNISVKEQLQHNLKDIGDLERIVGRISLGRTQLTDYLTLKKALFAVPNISSNLNNLINILDMQTGSDNLKDLLKDNLPITQNINSSNLISNSEIDLKKISLFKKINQKISNFSQLAELLEKSCNTDSSQDWLIKPGFNAELDRLRNLFEKQQIEILKLEQKEQIATGINSLKIKYNGISGYSIEITKANTGSVPDHYMRLQTLANKERYTTQELRNFEYEIQHATQEVAQLEKQLFENIKLQVEKYTNQLKKLSQALSYLDALIGLAHVAYENNYIRPKFNKDNIISIKDGKHPVAQVLLKEQFIPNDTQLDSEQLLWIITGPNMGGKSTYLRQVALISIMAQVGSFVPAAEANLSIVDRIFTRIGAGDNLWNGKSTFLVEMEETALICKQATSNSLVILDEVGRGTSTYDGLAIAQAVLEYIYTNVKAKCLFATHYHELTDLAKSFKGIATYFAASAQDKDTIILLHKIIPGVAHGSFGIEVAKVAQLPKALILRAEEILKKLHASKQELS